MLKIEWYFFIIFQLVIVRLRSVSGTKGDRECLLCFSTNESVWMASSSLPWVAFLFGLNTSSIWSVSCSELVLPRNSILSIIFDIFTLLILYFNNFINYRFMFEDSPAIHRVHLALAPGFLLLEFWFTM